eukprot:9165369-Pyramimonas_sp.AAC.2
MRGRKCCSPAPPAPPGWAAGPHTRASPRSHPSITKVTPERRPTGAPARDRCKLTPPDRTSPDRPFSVPHHRP